MLVGHKHLPENGICLSLSPTQASKSHLRCSSIAIAISPLLVALSAMLPTSGSGFWYMTDAQHFTYELLEKINDPTGKLIGYVLVQQSATLSANDLTYDAHGQGIFIPLYGTSSPPNPTTTHAVKTN
jgi:hypothetical protein